MVAIATTVHEISSVAYEVPGRPFTFLPVPAGIRFWGDGW